MAGHKSNQKSGTQKLYEWAGFAFVFIVSIVYVIWGLATIQKTGKTILEIVADAAITFTMGILISNLLLMQGIIWGELNDGYVATLNLYGDKLDEAVPHYGKLDAFCDYKNDIAYKRVRANMLQRVGLRYGDYFDASGAFIGKLIENPTDYEKKQNDAIKGTLELELTLLTPSDITSDGNEKMDDPNDLGVTKERFMLRSGAKQIFSKVILAIAFAYYTLQMVEDFDKGNLIWKLIQVILFVLAGLVQLYGAYQFMTGRYRQRIIKKVNLLEELIQFEVEIDA